MKHVVDTEYKEGMAFVSKVNGHDVVIDAVAEVGGQDLGPRPKELMLAALGGCTGMDVISILKKMRVEVEYFNVKVEAEMTEEHPKHYTAMHIIYQFKGKDLPMDKLEKAINLSQDRYCGVSFVYRKTMKLTHEIQILN
ncbi:MAG: putative redox protein [Tenuifilum sp.]|jgi:putative redox protein|uniref:OsmC family protein n=1 Tax=Tenuifilum sp. TaxID=2760880 RepID=UPI0024AC1D2C|nr:OsmC family protein [Tenuifilum sp.]MDI3526771.1 putative redox protein [Tenuifilum sp.]